MSLGRSVPWTSWEEWFQVGYWLQSKEASSVQKGLDRVATWRSRGRVPLGVDSTACFVECRLRDESGELSQLPLRMQYSLAVVRMVNGIADSSQKGRMAASVASLSAAAGLPRLLVDLRHEATHNELPSLAALQLAAHHALTWLRTNYWQKQKDHVELNKTKISKIVCDYIASHMAASIKAAATTQRQEYDSEDIDDDKDGDDDNGNGNKRARIDGDNSGEYNVAEARKQRQALLTELREYSSPVIVRALTHAMKHLLQEGWSQLPAVLLETAAAGLSPQCSLQENSTTVATGPAGPAADNDNSDTIAAKELDVQRASTLLRLLEVTLPCLEDKELQKRCLAVASRVHQIDNQTTAASGAGAVMAEAQPNIDVVADLQRLSYEVLDLEDACSKRSRSTEQKPEENNEAKSMKKNQRWTRCQNWKPCAIGTLPNAIDTNGTLPRLELKENLQLRDLLKQHDVAALGTAAGAAEGRSEDIGTGAVVAMSVEEDDSEQLDGKFDDTAAEAEELLDEEDELPLSGGTAVTTCRCPPPAAVRPRI
ncbi:hypothetical protein KSW81_000515 [Nannochloris sp. 'desiccata']|nr:hypothetical protein KSW81_000515 [Chlorella desiccata (nom. nud.)]